MNRKREAKNTMRFSNAALKKIKPPSEGRTFYYDESFPGLRLQVLQSGTKSFQLEKYSSVTKRNILKTLGKLGIIKYADAKRLAIELSDKIAKGKDLRKKTIKKAEEQRKRDQQDAITVRTFSEIFIREYRKKNGERKKSVGQDQKYFEVAINPIIGDLSLKKVTKSDVLKVLKMYDKDGHRISGNRCLACLGTAMEWALERDYITVNPCKHVPKLIKQEKSRERVLSSREIGRLWLALDDRVTSKLLKFLIITGQRTGEARNMRWSEILIVDGIKVWGIPAEKTKNGDSNTVPLPKIAVDLLETLDSQSEFVFQGPYGRLGASACRHNLNRLIKDWGWQPTNVHDFRSTFRTQLGELGVFDEIAEGLLNHRKNRIQRTYDRSLRLQQKKAAMNLWSDKLTEIILRRSACGCNFESLIVGSDGVELEKS